MWLNCTRSRVDAINLGRVISMLESEASMAPLRAARGFIGVFLLESTEAPGEITSMTWWESAEEGQAYLASPECRAVVTSIQEYLVRPLERSYYTVLIEVEFHGEAIGE
jgi:heme-degrading monooxygenase HmoA